MAKTKKANAAKAEKPLRGKDLMRKVVNKILDNPEQWNQSRWHCGTAHCVAGWAQVLGGKPQREDGCREDARELFGLSLEDADWLFSPSRSLPEIHAFASDFVNDRAGFDRAGFDCEGFDRDGFDREGFDRDGFDRDGFGRAGFDRAGFNRDGFNRAGVDRAGKKLPHL